jgi:hypothetical protein
MTLAASVHSVLATPACSSIDVCSRWICSWEVEGVQTAAGMNTAPPRQAEFILGVAQLDMSSNSTSTLTASIKTFQSDIKQDVAAAYAHALVSAYRYRRYNGCLAFVNAGGCIWTEGHPDERIFCANCFVATYSEDVKYRFTRTDSLVADVGVSRSPFRRGLACPDRCFSLLSKYSCLQDGQGSDALE